MGAISLSKKRQRYGFLSSWSNWVTLTGMSLTNANAGYYIVYSADLTLSNDEVLTGITVRANFQTQTPEETLRRTIRCSLYTSDPTAGLPSSAPSGYIQRNVNTVNVSEDGVVVEFRFSALNISGVNKLYFWFSDTTGNVNIADYQYEDDAYIAGTFTSENMSISLASDNVNVGEYQEGTITNGAGRSLTVQFYYGNTLLDATTTSTGSFRVEVSSYWFVTAGISDAAAMRVTVKIFGVSGVEAFFTAKANSDMGPSIRAIETEVVNDAYVSLYYPSTYISNVSACNVSASVTPMNGASVSQVVLSYDGNEIPMTYNSSTSKYEATTPKLVKNTVFRITATDSRGLKNYKDSNEVSVVQYSPPTLTINEDGTYRCDSSGNEEEGGAYWCAQASYTYCTDLPNNVVTATVQLSSTTQRTIPSDFSKIGPYGGNLTSSVNYTLTFRISDKVTGLTESTVIKKTYILRADDHDIVIKRDVFGTHVGIGKAPSLPLGSGIEMPYNYKVYTGGIPIDALISSVGGVGGDYFNKDFLNVTQYQPVSDNNATAHFDTRVSSGWSNMPPEVSGLNWAGWRFVLSSTSNGAIVIIIEIRPVPGRIWINVNEGNSWIGWKQVTPT